MRGGLLNGFRRQCHLHRCSWTLELALLKSIFRGGGKGVLLSVKAVNVVARVCQYACAILSLLKFHWCFEHKIKILLYRICENTSLMLSSFYILELVVYCFTINHFLIINIPRKFFTSMIICLV